eukprot:2207341-Pleurochrysis_carterae.AAC.2
MFKPARANWSQKPALCSADVQHTAATWQHTQNTRNTNFVNITEIASSQPQQAWREQYYWLLLCDSASPPACLRLGLPEHPHVSARKSAAHLA